MLSFFIIIYIYIYIYIHIYIYIYSGVETEIVISESKKPDKKKFDVRIDNKKTALFGQKGASDFTKHKDKERKKRYVDRHNKQ